MQETYNVLYGRETLFVVRICNKTQNSDVNQNVYDVAFQNCDVTSTAHNYAGNHDQRAPSGIRQQWSEGSQWDMVTMIRGLPVGYGNNFEFWRQEFWVTL